jgi:hypothetical protein
MNIRSVAQILLLAFVAVGLAFAIANVAGRNSTPATDDSAVATTGVATAHDEGSWVAYYFHAKHRCPTCQKIEAYAQEALFPDIEQGAMAWHVVDYTAPENRALVDQFDVMTSTVVLVRRENGQVVRFQNLEDEVWTHFSDHDEFLSMMRQAARAFREES